MSGRKRCVDLSEDVWISGSVADVGDGNVVGAVESDLNCEAWSLGGTERGRVVPARGFLFRRHETKVAEWK